MSISKGRKYFELVKIKPLLTYYRIYLFDKNTLAQMEIQFASKSDPLQIYYKLINSKPQEQPVWSWEELD